MSEFEHTCTAEYDNRTYIKGAAGALLGALLGAVAWAIVYKLGYVAGLVGLLIGFLASKGYDLLKGKQGKGKIVILILAVILGVVAGTAGGLCWKIIEDMNELGIGMEYFGDCVELLMQDSEFTGKVGGNLLKGLFFAAIGVVGFLISEGKKFSKKNQTQQ